MASKTRARPAGYSKGIQVTSTEFNIVDTNAAACVARTSTTGGLKVMPMHCAGIKTSAATHYYVQNGTQFFACNTATTTSRLVSWDLYLPYGHTLNGVNLRIDPAAGHVLQPESLPKIILYTIDASGTVVTLGSGADSWTSTAAYEAAHNLTISTLAHTVANKTYRLEFQNEGGSGAISPLKIVRLIADVSVDTASGGTDFSFWI